MYYYLDSNGQQQGPIAANELPKFGVTRRTYVWKQGMGEWQKAGSVDELNGIFRAKSGSKTTGISQSKKTMAGLVAAGIVVAMAVLFFVGKTVGVVGPSKGEITMTTESKEITGGAVETDMTGESENSWLIGTWEHEDSPPHTYIFDGKNYVSVETHIFDYDRNRYVPLENGRVIERGTYRVDGSTLFLTSNGNTSEILIDPPRKAIAFGMGRSEYIKVSSNTSIDELE